MVDPIQSHRFDLHMGKVTLKQEVFQIKTEGLQNVCMCRIFLQVFWQQTAIPKQTCLELRNNSKQVYLVVTVMFIQFIQGLLPEKYL